MRDEDIVGAWYDEDQKRKYRVCRDRRRMNGLAGWTHTYSVDCGFSVGVARSLTEIGVRSWAEKGKWVRWTGQTDRLEDARAKAIEAGIRAAARLAEPYAPSPANPWWKFW